MYNFLTWFSDYLIWFDCLIITCVCVGMLNQNWSGYYIPLFFLKLKLNAIFNQFLNRSHHIRSFEIQIRLIRSDQNKNWGSNHFRFLHFAFKIDLLRISLIHCIYKYTKLIFQQSVFLPCDSRFRWDQNWSLFGKCCDPWKAQAPIIVFYCFEFWILAS